MVTREKNQFAKLVSLWQRHRGQESVSPKLGKIRLADFIHRNTERTLSEWETFAQTLRPVSNGMTLRAMRSRIRPILAFIVNDLGFFQTGLKKIQKSHGKNEKSYTYTTVQTDAALKIASRIDNDRMVSQYHTERSYVVRLRNELNPRMSNIDRNSLLPITLPMRPRGGILA